MLEGTPGGERATPSTRLRAFPAPPGPPPSGAPLPGPLQSPAPRPGGGSCAAAGWPAGLTPGQSPGTGCQGDKHANGAGAGGRPGPGAQDGAEPVQSASTDGQLERRHLPGGGTRHCSGTPRPAPRPAAGASPLTQQTPNTRDIPPRLGPQEVHLLSHKPRSHAPRLFLGVPWPPKPHASPSVQSPTRCPPSSQVYVFQRLQSRCEGGALCVEAPPPPAPDPVTHTL